MKFKFDPRMGRMVGSKTQILQRYEIERLGGVIPDKGHTNPGTAYIPEEDVMQVKAAARRAGVDVYRLNGYDKDIGGGLYRFEKTTTFESTDADWPTPDRERLKKCWKKYLSVFESFVNTAIDNAKTDDDVANICGFRHSIIDAIYDYYEKTQPEFDEESHELYNKLCNSASAFDYVFYDMDDPKETTTEMKEEEFENRIFVEDDEAPLAKLTKDAIEDAIPCDAKDGLMDVNEPDGSFGRYTWYVRFAPGSQDEAEDAAAAIENALGRRTQVADFGRFVAVIVKPTRDDIVGESSKMEFTITAITEWYEDKTLIDGDCSHEPKEDVMELLRQEHELKEGFLSAYDGSDYDDQEWAKALPFTCIAENLDDALDQYNQKFCEYDYLKAIDAEYDVREPEEEVEVLGTRLRG